MAKFITTTSSALSVVATTLVLAVSVTPALARPAPVTPASSVSTTASTNDSITVPLALEDDCATNTAAASNPGWFPDRYTQCRRGAGIYDVFDEGNVKVGEIHLNIMMMGYGNNGAREFNYLVNVSDIVKIGAPDLVLEAAELSMWFACNASLTPCTAPASGARTDTIAGWQAANYFSTTLTSPEVAGAGDQIDNERFALVIHLATPGQPYISGPPVEAAYSKVRYDSASYVGRARGAVFLDYKLVLSLSLSMPDQDESALHIRDALRYPDRTFPSWLGKSVPGSDDEPLTRMYNSSNNDANRRNSEAMCTNLYGSWDSALVNCDEFPFASTYEGSKTGPASNGGLLRYSVRLIDATDNQYVGRQLLEIDFYRANRVLDGDKFAVHVLA